MTFMGEHIMGYLIEWRPFTYEENGRGEIYKNRGDFRYEYCTDESELLGRCTQLEDTIGEFEPNKFCDGLEFETYICQLERYRR